MKPGKKLYGTLSIYLFFYTAIKVAFIFTGPGLFTEEAQYWVWSQNLDWSYYSKPPLIAWINYCTGIFGHSEGIIRFTALFFGLGTLYFIHRLALLLFREPRIAVMSVIFLSISPYFFLASTFFTTDTLLMFFWMSCLYYIFKAQDQPSFHNWMLAGISFGLGNLSKYTMFFLLFTLVPLLLSNQGQQYAKGAFLFICIGIFMFMPVIWWNYTYDWVSLKHLSMLATASPTFFSWRHSLQYLSEYIGGIVLINSPFMAILFIKKEFRQSLFHHQKHSDRHKFMMLLAPIIGTLLVFLFISVFQRTEVNWPAMSYQAIPLLLAYGVEKAANFRNAFTAAGLTFCLLLLFLFPTFFDRTGLSFLLPPKVDSMRRMAGWKELSIKVKEIHESHSGYEAVLTDNYHVASEISFYTLLPNIYCLDNGRRMNQFDIWGGLEGLSKSPFNAIYITQAEAKDLSLAYDQLDAHFRLPVLYRGEEIKIYHIYLLSNLRISPRTHFTEF